MSTEVIDFPESKRRKRSDYSKKGCKECKRRKIKCNEAKPSCWQCARLDKSCVYPEPGEKVLRISKRSLNKDGPLEFHHQFAVGSGSSPGSSEETPQKQPSLNHHTNVQPSRQSVKLEHIEHPPITQIGLTQPHLPFQAHSPVPSPHQQPHQQPQQLNQQPPQQSQQPHQPHQQPHQPHQQDHRSVQTPNVPSPIYTHSRLLPTPGHPISLPPIPTRTTSNLSNTRFTPSSINNLLNETKMPPSSGISKGSPESSSSDTQESSVFDYSQPYAHVQNSINSKVVAHERSPASNHGDNMLLMKSDTYQFFNQEDLNLLANDLNNIVTDVMFQSNYEDKPYEADSEKVPTILAGPKSKGSIITPAKPGNHNTSLPADQQIPRNIPFDYIPVTKYHEKLYLEEFYNDFANVVSPFKAFDKQTNAYYNPARDILLKCASQESFLLAAILAQGAKSAFNKNNLPEDEEAYCSYLSKSLKLLGPALSGSSSEQTKEQNDLASNIEAVLLTVLLLTSSNAANTKQNWRPHLRGAKDLLLKITSSKTQVRNSPTLVFCKYWFISIEILAGLSSKLGGTLKSDAELDLLLTCGSEYEINMAKNMGIILENGFNLLGGYHNHCVFLLRDVIKLLNKIRLEQSNFVPSDVFEYIRLLSKFHEQCQVEFINRKCILSEDDFKDGIVPQGCLLDTLTVQKSKVIISWMDLSQQAYSLASMIIILTKGLQVPYHSPQLQTIIDKMISLLSFLGNTGETSQLIDCSIMIIQCPMLVAGMNCVKEEHKFLIMKLFRCAARVGSGSANFALRRINKVWTLHNSNDNKSDSEDDIDIVLY